MLQAPGLSGLIKTVFKNQLLNICILLTSNDLEKGAFISYLPHGGRWLYICAAQGDLTGKKTDRARGDKKGETVDF